MKKLIFALLLMLVLAGCATMTYKTPDGTEVTYSRLLTTSDTIKGTVGGATIETTGTKIDTATLQAILQLMGTVK